MFVPQAEGGLPTTEVTVAKALRDYHQYDTGFIGKWSASFSFLLSLPLFCMLLLTTTH